MPENQPDESAFPVVIIGGGLAGLTAAAVLAEQGITPLVLEADSVWPGGRLSGGDPETFDYQGRVWSFKPDHGVHAVWGGYDNLRVVLEKFTNAELTPSFGEEWINRWGRHVRMIEAGTAIRSRWMPAPFHHLQLLLLPRIWHNITPLDFLSLPGFLFSILWTVGFDPVKEQTALEGLALKDYFRGWTPNLRATFTGLAVNLLAAPADKISLSAFIAALRFYTILRRDSWQMQYFSGNSHDTVIAPLIQAVETRGGRVLQGVTAQKLYRHENGWRIQVEDNGRGYGVRSIRANQVILALNAPAARRLLLASDAAAPAAQHIDFPEGLRNVTIRLWFSGAPRAGTQGGMFTGDFVPDNFFWLHRLYAEFAEWHAVTGGSAIEVHIYGPDAVLDQPDSNLLILAVDDVQRAFPEVRGTFIYGTIRRNSRVHTQFRIPTASSLYVQTPWSGIHACGDWIGHPTPSLWMERAAVTALSAANNVLVEMGIAAVPVLPPRKPELLVRMLAVLVRGIRLLFAPLIYGLRQVRRSRK